MSPDPINQNDPSQIAPKPEDVGNSTAQLTSLGRAINTQNLGGSPTIQSSSQNTYSAPHPVNQNNQVAAVTTTVEVSQAEQSSVKDNIYTEICTQIIKHQQQIIGDLAVEQADLVEGLTVDPITFRCTVSGDGSKVINDLIEQYRDFFGYAAVEVCKEAASRFLVKLPDDEKPALLR